MYKIDGNKVSLFNLYGANAKFKITHEFELKNPLRFTDNTPNLDVFMMEIIGRLRNEYNDMASKEKTIRQGYYGISEVRPRVTSIVVSENMLDNIINNMKTNLSISAASRTTRQHDAKSCINVLNNNAASYISDAQYYAYREGMLSELIDTLALLRKREVSHVYLLENSNVINELRANYSAYINKDVTTNKFSKMQYKTLSLNEANENDAELAWRNNDILLNLGNNHRYNIEEGCLKMSLAAPNKIPVVKRKMNLLVLYPQLKADVRSLQRYTANLGEYRDVTTFIKEYLSIIWKSFNSIKTKLILLGYDEVTAVKFINALCFKNKPLKTCQITKQLMPEFFIVPLKPHGTDTILDANVCYLDGSNIGQRRNGMDGDADGRIIRYKNNNTKGFWWETKINDADLHFSQLKHHKADPLEFLTPCTEFHDDTRAYTEDKGYRPTPYLGVELEVERVPDKYDADEVAGRPPREAVTIQHGQQIPTGTDGQWMYYANTWYQWTPRKGWDAKLSQGKPTFTCDPDISNKVLNILGRDFTIIKHDGTLGGQMPFEIVTVPAPLGYHKKAWLPFLKAKEVKANLQSYASGKCGMHVHISRDSFTGLHLAKFMRFINMAENDTFITAIAQRKGNNYARSTPNLGLKQAAELIRDKRGRDTSHYQAVNTANEHTVEVRIFRGNLGTTQFFKNLEFVHAVWAYTLTCSMTELNYKHFLYWLFDNKANHHKLYANLEKWLVASEITVESVRITKTTSDAEKTIILERKKHIKKIQEVTKRKFKKVTKVPMESVEELLASA